MMGLHPYGKKLCIILLLFVSTAIAQTDTVCTVPFASKGNTIELAVANTASIAVSNVTVALITSPSWIKFDSTKCTIAKIAGSTEQSATFSFSIDKNAPTGQKQNLTFQITSGGQQWTKQIAVKAGVPNQFELYHNFPNPFNPSTTISYQLPTDSKVSLKIYDVLGREVATLLDNQTKPAGYYEQQWNASHYASGMYVYRLFWMDQSGKTSMATKSMVMVK
jgi:Secretion system C-terminal sorting domain